VRERSSHIQRLQKTLEDANVKLDSVISDIVGLSARRMIEALIPTGQARGLKAHGETEPGALAALAHRRIKATPDQLEAALRGHVTRHHRFLLRLHLQQIDALDAAIEQIDQEVDADVEPFRAAIALLTTIPGVSELSARIILAEIGHDMSRFPTAGHLISWAGLCPRNDESPTGQARGLKAHGKRRSVRMRKSLPSRRRGEPPGLRRPLSNVPVSNVPGPPRARKPAISRRSFIVCAPVVAPKRRSARSLPRSSPRSTTC
jgi:transposase